MSPSFDADMPGVVWTSTAFWMIAKVSALLAIATIAQALIRRRTSAATRHLVWTLAVASLLLLPLLSAMLPSWPVAVRVSALPASAAAPAPPTPTGAEPDAISSVVTSPVAAPTAAVTPTAAATPTATVTPVVVSSAPSTTAPAPMTSDRFRAPLFFVVLYAAGVLFLLLRQAAQWWTLARLARRSGEVRDPEWTRLFLVCASSMGVSRPVRLLRSCEQTMPMAFGVRRPAILIPAMADLWSEDRRRAVLLHELAHVARRDCLTQMSAAMACALYWMHPGVWWVARRLRIERELACDDRVLTVGTQAREYASHLLELAYSLGGQRAPALAVTMARPQQLEGRMLAVLDAARNRATPGIRSRFAGVAIATALLLPLAGLEAKVVPAGVDGAGERAATNLTDMSSDEPTASSVESLAAAATQSAQDRLTLDGQPGTWEIRPGETEDTVHLRLTERDSSSGFTIAADRLEGLSRAQRSGSEGGPVRFAIRRDAGTFTFEGLFRSGVGGGTFTFALNPAFPDALVKRGLARPTPADQLALARSDIGFAFLDELTTQGYPKPDLALLVRAGQHGAGLDYLRGMASSGYRVGSLESLINLRDHGITPDYIRALAAEGYKGLPVDGLLRARDHGISPDYVRQMRDYGYGSLTMEALINARNHGVSGDYVRQLGELGHRKLSLEDVIRFRDHGISADYVREMRDLGYALTLEQLQKARDHGVSADFVRDLANLGHRNLPLDALIRARDHGVSPEYAREIKALGYDHLDLDELAGLRDHGVTPDRIRRANARAGTQLPLDMIKTMADGGLR
jgi:beta-lactamase regulating signal transducer with metallopeptidase domain